MNRAILLWWIGGVPSLALLALTISCGGTESPKGSKLVEGGGPIVPWKATSQLLSEDGSFAGSLVGESTLLVVRDPDGAARVTALAAPGNGDVCTGFPVAIATGDVNGDSVSDLLVLDPGCGNWLALSQGDSLRPVPWSTTLPDVTPRHFIDYRDMNGDGLDDVVSATSSGAEFLVQGADGWTMSQLIAGFPETHPMATTSLLIGPTPAGDNLFQRASLLDTLSFPNNRVERGGTLEQEELEFLREFDGYDQLSPLSDPDCADFSMAVGTFLDQPRVPRRLDLLSMTATGYTAREVAVTGRQVFLVQTVTSSTHSFIGVVSGNSQQFYFDLLRHADCRVQAIASWPVSRLPGFRVEPATPDEALVDNAGERLLGIERAGELRFQYYDGRSLYVYRIAIDGSYFLESAIAVSP